jgi:hypothetical protein
MDLNRSLQLSILKELKDKYPISYPLQELGCYHENQDFNGNLIYLSEHKLIEGEVHYPRKQALPCPQMFTAKITAHGLDFLEDDGGLRAILNKITVKLDSDDLQALISARLNRDNVPEEKKKEILNTIKSLPSDGIKTIYNRLLNLALDNTPDVIDLIQKLLDH